MDQELQDLQGQAADLKAQIADREAKLNASTDEAEQLILAKQLLPLHRQYTTIIGAIGKVQAAQGKNDTQAARNALDQAKVEIAQQKADQAKQNNPDVLQQEAIKNQNAAAERDERQANAAKGIGYMTNKEAADLQRAKQTGDAATVASLASAADSNAQAERARLEGQLAAAKAGPERDQIQANINALNVRAAAEAQAMGKPDVVATNTTAPFLMSLAPDGKGGWKWQQEPNPNQLTVSDSVLRLYSQLAPLTGSGQGQIPLETATSLLTSAYQAMSATTAAATQQENARHDQASEAETGQHNRATEADSAAQQAETGRHNQATEQTAQDQLDTTERGQTLDYASKASEAASTATTALAKDYLPPEAGAYIMQLLSGNTNAPVPTSFTANPYDPLAAARSAAAEVLAHISPSARSHIAATTGQFPGAGGGSAPTTAPPAAAPSTGYIPAPNTGGWYGAGQPSAQTPGSLPAQGHAITINIGGTGSLPAPNTGGTYVPPSFTAPGAPPMPTTDANGLLPSQRQN